MINSLSGLILNGVVVTTPLVFARRPTNRSLSILASNTLSVPTRARRPHLAAEFLRLINSRWFQELMVGQANMISPLSGMPVPGIQQGLGRIIRETENFYSFSFGLEGAHPFLYRQYWNEWNKFMVARELSATQLLENLELIFTNYYNTLGA